MNRAARGMKTYKVVLAAGLAVLSTLCLAADEEATAPDLSLYLKVQLPAAIKMSKLKPGEVVRGKLARDVYSSDRELFSAGSDVRLTVDHLEKRKRPRNDHWPWVVSVFTPRRQNYPAFKNATVKSSGGDSSLNVSLISVSRKRDVHAQAKKNKSGQSAEKAAVQVDKSTGQKSSLQTMVLEATATDSAPLASPSNNDAADFTSSESRTLPAGMRCKILLLGDVSASKSQPGDRIQARLLEPVLMDSRVALPAGTLFEGKVIKKTPPRWLSRAGSLYLAFTEMSLPNGTQIPIAATLAGAELDRASHTRIDAEGQLRGERPGKAWMAINLGVTAGISKEVDDGLQLVIEAIVSTATDVSTAGTARIAASCASALYMVTRHGRDVVIPRFTEMDISLDRPVSLKPVPSESIGAAGGK
jgi:hypothetical protein